MLSGRDGHLIATKLGCTKPKQGRHVKFAFKVHGTFYRYGVSHNSKKENQDHIAHALGISVSEAKRLANCQMSEEDFIKVSRHIGTGSVSE